MSIAGAGQKESTWNRAATVQQRMGNRENLRRPLLNLRSAQAPRSPTHARAVAPLQTAERSFAEILAGAGRRGEEASRASLVSRPIGQRSQLVGADPVVASSFSPKMPLQKDAEAIASSIVIPARIGGSHDGISSGGIPFADMIAASAKKYGVSSDLVAAVVKAESGFSPLAQSRAGAKGLMQLMDGTARSLGVSNVFDPEQNIDGGVRFLSSLLKRFDGDARLALAGYNAGPGAVEKYGGVPPYKETKDYVSKVLNYWQEFARAGGGSVP